MDKQLIADIMNKVGSDKTIPHHYEIAYSKIFDRPVQNLLEIGIANSVKERSSLWGWSQLFPDAAIYGIDIVSEKMINDGKIMTFLANQGSHKALENVIDLLGQTKMDVIIDDGSHWFNDASVSFEVLFGKLLITGGLYIIEDIQKSEKTRNSIMSNQQTIEDWTDFLNNKEIKFKVFDCVPDKQDDSLLVVVEKLT